MCYTNTATVNKRCDKKNTDLDKRSRNVNVNERHSYTIGEAEHVIIRDYKKMKV